jgi:MFS family permease
MNKALIFVLTAVFVLVLGAFISGTILTPYAQDMRATWLQIGILSGSMYVIRLFISTPTGRLADKKGTLKVLQYSLLLYPFIAIAYWFSFDIYSLIGARLLHGVASAMMLPMAMAYVGQASPRGREGRYVSKYNLCIMLASGIGPLISTVIVDLSDYKSTFIMLFILAIIALLVVVFSQKDLSTEHETCNKPHIVKNEHLNSINLLRNKGLMALSFANISLAIVSSLVGFFLILFLKDRGMDLIFTGSVLAVYNIVSGISQLPLGRIIDKYNKFLIALLSSVGTAAALLIFPMSKSIFILGAATILLSFGFAVLSSATSALSIIVGREIGMGSTMGFLSTANSIGMIFGCISISLMPIFSYKYELFFYFCSATVIVSTILFAILWARSKSYYSAS